MVELINVCKVFNKSIYALKNVNLVIYDKELIVVLGPSGCGKTTLLKLISGLESPSSGIIKINNKDISKNHNENISFVFQDYALYPNMTVFQNISFPLKNLKQKKRDIITKVEIISKKLKIFDILNRYPSELSGGQCQRVALARSIVKKPNLYLFDEPLCNLDANLRYDMRKEIVRIYGELNSSFIYVTHDQIEGLSIATRVILMNNGEIQQIGTPQEVYNNPKNLFVARFLGLPVMNCIKICNLINKNKLLNKLCLDAKNKMNNIVVSFRPFVCHYLFEIDNRVDDIIIIYGKITNIEFHGHYSLIEIINNYGEKVVFANKSSTFQYGDNISIYIKIDDLYLFDEITGERILID